MAVCCNLRTADRAGAADRRESTSAGRQEDNATHRNSAAAHRSLTATHRRTAQQATGYRPHARLTGVHGSRVDSRYQARLGHKCRQQIPHRRLHPAENIQWQPRRQAGRLGGLRLLATPIDRAVALACLPDTVAARLPRCQPVLLLAPAGSTSPVPAPGLARAHPASALLA
jgi:hypothetical protein